MRNGGILGRERIIAGRDLVDITLSKNPDEVLRQPTPRRVVLVQAAYPFDEEAFIELVTNSAFISYTLLAAAAIKPDDGRLPPLLDVFRLIICDACCPEEGATLQDTYDARLRVEELQTPVELAREIIRQRRRNSSTSATCGDTITSLVE